MQQQILVLSPLILQSQFDHTKEGKADDRDSGGTKK